MNKQSELTESQISGHNAEQAPTLSQVREEASRMPDLRAPTLAEILQATKNIAGKAIRSPLIKFQGDTGGVQAEIWLKLENLQPTGANSQKNPMSSPC